MKIYEHQAKELLSRYGIAVPNGAVASSVKKAASVYRKILKKGRCAIKAQIYAGDRAEAGGIKIVSGLPRLKKVTKKILGKRLVTSQTGPRGLLVRKVLVEEAVPAVREFYLGITYDRGSGFPILLASRIGKVEIEKLRKIKPKAIIRENINPFTGILPYQSRRIAYNLGLKGEAAEEAARQISYLVKAFFDLDLLLLEINPWGLTRGKKMIAIDCKIDIDDDSLFRHPDLAKLLDASEENRLGRQAKELGLNYIAFDGNIGCMVNGAGLAMATMDIIKLHGGEPANFLDVGGWATVEQVKEGFKILLADRRVKAILVNIFGGIMKCDTIAQGIIEAARKVKIKVPVVVRLEGTNVERGRNLLSRTKVNLITASDMEDVAKKVVEATTTRRIKIVRKIKSRARRR